MRRRWPHKSSPGPRKGVGRRSKPTSTHVMPEDQPTASRCFGTHPKSFMGTDPKSYMESSTASPLKYRGASKPLRFPCPTNRDGHNSFQHGRS
eukprot:1159736-Pelagomonas_calceolata.AAC.1